MTTLYGDYIIYWGTSSSSSTFSNSYSTFTTSKYNIRIYPFFQKIEVKNYPDVIITEDKVFQYLYETKEFLFDPEELVI